MKNNLQRARAEQALDEMTLDIRALKEMAPETPDVHWGELTTVPVLYSYVDKDTSPIEMIAILQRKVDLLTRRIKFEDWLLSLTRDNLINFSHGRYGCFPNHNVAIPHEQVVAEVMGFELHVVEDERYPDPYSFSTQFTFAPTMDVPLTTTPIGQYCVNVVTNTVMGTFTGDDKAKLMKKVRRALREQHISIKTLKRHDIDDFTTTFRED